MSEKIIHVLNSIVMSKAEPLLRDPQTLIAWRGC